MSQSSLITLMIVLITGHFPDSVKFHRHVKILRQRPNSAACRKLWAPSHDDITVVTILFSFCHPTFLCRAFGLICMYVCVCLSFMFPYYLTVKVRAANINIFLAPMFLITLCINVFKKYFSDRY